MEVERGREVVQALLRERTTDLRYIDAEGFRDWLQRQLAGWRRDPVFAQRERIRDLRRACPGLRALEREVKHSRQADAASPGGERLGQVEEELRGVEQGVAGLAGASEGAAPARRAELREKLAAFEARRASLTAERDALTAASPARMRLLRAESELRRLRAQCGLEAEEARLEELLREQGQRSGRSGGGFEEIAVQAIREHLLPEMGEPEPVILAGVKLGAAGTEIDQVIVRRGDPVEVLAVVEAKRNPNDVAHGFTRRHADLAWLSGDRRAYDPAARVTRHFPTGHFDRPAVHEQYGERFVFAPGSFRRFGPDRLFFVTRVAPLAGLSTGALARLRHRVATDDAPPDELLAWCRTLAEPVETPDVLRLIPDQILFIPHGHTEARR
ncbi:MAG TPA: hypothetical protein VF613_13430 [Longimicrobium sp.]|jgi:hypothetical protein